MDKRTKINRDIVRILYFMAGMFLVGFGFRAQEVYAQYQEKQKEIEAERNLLGNPDFISPLPSIRFLEAEKQPEMKFYTIEEIEAMPISTPSAQVNAHSQVVEYTQLVLKYLPKYYPNVYDQSRMMPVFSCLLRNESGHFLNKGFGDGGRAGGILQFHEPTFKAYRKIMIAKGFVSHVGDRMNPEDAIETMIWAFSDGRGNAWGPYARKECR